MLIIFVLHTMTNARNNAKETMKGGWDVMMLACLHCGYSFGQNIKRKDETKVATLPNNKKIHHSCQQDIV